MPGKPEYRSQCIDHLFWLIANKQVSKILLIYIALSKYSTVHCTVRCCLLLDALSLFGIAMAELEMVSQAGVDMAIEP